jgi:hypothetical protein
MKKAVVLVLCGLAMALSVLACGQGKEEEVVPLEATTTQGNRLTFPQGEISWADAVVSFTPGNPAAGRSTDPKAALGKPDYQGTDDAQDEATYVSIGHGGELVLEFRDNVLVDGDGQDLAGSALKTSLRLALIGRKDKSSALCYHGLEGCDLPEWPWEPMSA